MSEGIFQGMVRNFHAGIGQKADADLRISLIQEEGNEFIDAVGERDIIAAIDALCDLLYVVYGTADVYKVHLDTLVAEATPVAKEVDWARIGSELPDFVRVKDKALEAIKTFETMSYRKALLTRELENLANMAWHFGALGLGVDLAPFFKEVHRTNMHKLEGPKREDGKQLKPPGWKPPRIEEMYSKLQSGTSPICEGSCPIANDELRTAGDHPSGGYICTSCGGLIVATEAI